MKKPLRKSNFLTSSLKTPVVLGESLGFFITVSLMFLFLHVFISSDVLGVFIVDCICPFHCFFTVVVTASATDLRERFLLSGVFFLTLLPAFIKASLELEVQP